MFIHKYYNRSCPNNSESEEQVGQLNTIYNVLGIEMPKLNHKNVKMAIDVHAYYL